MGSSPTRAQTCDPCIGRWILNHCTTREAPKIVFWKVQFFPPHALPYCVFLACESPLLLTENTSPLVTTRGRFSPTSSKSLRHQLGVLHFNSIHTLLTQSYLRIPPIRAPSHKTAPLPTLQMPASSPGRPPPVLLTHQLQQGPPTPGPRAGC